MRRPPYGICLPCRLRRVRDGDTVEVSVLGSDRLYALRLIDCWAPESNCPAGKQSTAKAEELIGKAKALAIFIPAPHDPLRLLRSITFDRIPAYLFLSGSVTLNEAMVKAGHAAATKAACEKKWGSYKSQKAGKGSRK
ncbi:MAG: hypothetical protein V1755_06575 [Chloroflexota bacterium]